MEGDAGFCGGHLYNTPYSEVSLNPNKVQIQGYGFSWMVLNYQLVFYPLLLCQRYNWHFFCHPPVTLKPLIAVPSFYLFTW